MLRLEDLKPILPCVMILGMLDYNNKGGKNGRKKQ